MSTRPPINVSAGISLLEILPDAKPVNASNVLVSSACGQWNECQPDDVFVAVVGDEIDGHDFAVEAQERGATAVIGERLMAVNGPQFLVADSRMAFGQICHALAGRPSARLSTIGIAGSNGKTVTAHLLRSILKEAGNQPGTATSIETQLGGISYGPKTNGSAALLADQLARMVMADCSHAIVEASSIALAQHSLAGFELDVAVVTNLSQRNLTFHGSKDNYQRSTGRLLEYLKPGGFTILNADDRATHDLLDELSVPCLTFGIHQQAEVTAKLLDRNRNCQTFVLSAGVESIPVRTSVIGKQHIYSCLAAATVALALDIELDIVARGLETACIPGRLERVDCGQSFGVWVDSASTPSQLSGAIAAVSPVCEGRIFCIGSTHEDQSDDDRKRIGRILERKSDIPVITQSKLANRIDYESCHQVLDGFENVSRAHVIPDRLKAIHWALQQAKPEDCILIAGAGEKPQAILEASGQEVSDRDICQAWLYDNSDRTTVPEPKIFRFEDYRYQ